MTTARLNKTKKRSEGFIFILPVLVILAFVALYPLLYSIFMSFFNWNWGTRMDFVGFHNFTYWFTSGKFWNALSNTVVFTVGAVVIEVALGVFLATTLNNLRAGLGFVRTIIMLPLMVSGIVVSLIWKILLDPTLGIVNYFLVSLGLNPSPFFGGPSTAMPSIIMVDVWWQTAYIFIIVTAGIKSLPAEPYEAAKVDGANAWQTFWYLTIPMVKPVIIIATIFRIIDCMKVFAIIYGTTGGGPGQATEAVQILAYRTAFSFLEMSRGMSLMVIFSILIMAIVLVYMKVTDNEDAKVSN